MLKHVPALLTPDALHALAILACGETRTYGNLPLRKGVLREGVR